MRRSSSIPTGSEKKVIDMVELKHYTVTFIMDDIEINIRARNQREARKIARKKWREGKLKPKLRHKDWTGYGTNIVVEHDWRYLE